MFPKTNAMYRGFQKNQERCVIDGADASKL